MVHRPPAERRRDDPDRPHRRDLHDRRCGDHGLATSSSSLTTDDVSDEGFGFLTCREIRGRRRPASSPRGSPTSASSAGSCTCRWIGPRSCGTRCSRPGATHGAVPVGIGVYGTTGRIEKGYRAFGFELDAERSIVEAGMQRPKVKAADFVGKEAYLKQRDEAPKTVLCTLTVDDHTSASGIKRYMLGGEPILTRDGGTLTDGHGHHPYVTTAGSAPSLGKHVLLAYLPPAEARIGNQLAVSYMEERYPVTVVSVDATRRSTPRTQLMNDPDTWTGSPGLRQAGARRRGRSC